jgi:predicted acyltransferase (DUF342 family)
MLLPLFALHLLHILAKVGIKHQFISKSMLHILAKVGIKHQFISKSMLHILAKVGIKHQFISKSMLHILIPLTQCVSLLILIVMYSISLLSKKNNNGITNVFTFNKNVATNYVFDFSMLLKFMTILSLNLYMFSIHI